MEKAVLSWLSSLNEQCRIPSQGCGRRFEQPHSQLAGNRAHPEAEKDGTSGSWHPVAVVAKYKQLLLPFLSVLLVCDSHTRTA